MRLRIPSKALNRNLDHESQQVLELNPGLLPQATCTLPLSYNLQTEECKGCQLSTSLVPRPSYHLVFDCLQYAKTEGEGPFYHMSDVTVYLHKCTIQVITTGQWEGVGTRLIVQFS